jgi:hypothetical protein
MGTPVKTDTIVHERDSKGNIIRTEIVPAGTPLPDWASEVGDHVFEVVDDIEVTEPEPAPADPNAGAPVGDPNVADPNAGQPADGQPQA